MRLLRGFLLGMSLIFAADAASGKVRVEYRISKMQGLLSFTLANAGYHHQAPGLSEILVKSPYNTEDLKKSLANIQTLQRSLHISFEGQSQTKLRNYGNSVLNLVVIQSIHAKNLSDFSTRVQGLLPAADHNLLFRELKKIEPVYEKLIWKDLSPSLSQHKTHLEELAKVVKLDQMFAQTEKFYNATWPEDSPFIIALYPIPYIKDFKNSSNSQSIDSVEVHGVIVKKDDKKKINLAGSFGVIFHELCHSIYGAQEDAFQVRLENHFLQSPSAYASQAYSFVNEALATAIGNGWAYSKANKGQLDKETWYNDPTINGFAQEIYPLVKEALEKGHSLSGEMVASLINAYEKRFPKAIYAFDSLFNRLLITHDGEEIRSPELRTVVKKTFKVRILNIGSPMDHAQSLQNIVASEQDSLMFVFTEKGSDQLEQAAQEIPYIRNNLKALQNMKNRSIFAGLNDKGRAFVFVKIETEKDWEESIAALAKKEFIDPAVKIWSY